jgi:hypothetical protein
VGIYFGMSSSHIDFKMNVLGSGAIHAFEFKWNKDAKAKFSKTVTRAYQEAVLTLVNSENGTSFIL